MKWQWTTINRHRNTASREKKYRLKFLWACGFQHWPICIFPVLYVLLFIEAAFSRHYLFIKWSLNSWPPMPLVKHWMNFTIHTHFHQKFYQRLVQRNTRQSFIISLYFRLNRKMTKQSYKACHSLETIKNLYRCDRRKWKEIYGMTIKMKIWSKMSSLSKLFYSQ